MGVAMVICVAALASAQPGPVQQGDPQNSDMMRGRPGPMMMATAKSVHLEGKLAFENDRPVLETKDGRYYLAIRRFYYYAYTEGFKAGDTFKVDGYLMTPPPAPAAQTAQDGTKQVQQAQPAQDQLPVIFVTKLVVGSKTFDFSASFNQGFGPGMGMGMEREPEMAPSGTGRGRRR